MKVWKKCEHNDWPYQRILFIYNYSPAVKLLLVREWCCNPIGTTSVPAIAVIEKERSAQYLLLAVVVRRHDGSYGSR